MPQQAIFIGFFTLNKELPKFKVAFSVTVPIKSIKVVMLGAHIIEGKDRVKHHIRNVSPFESWAIVACVHFQAVIEQFISYKSPPI